MERDTDTGPSFHPHSLIPPRPRLFRHPEHLSPTDDRSDYDDQDDQPTPKMNANAPLAGDNPAARFRALLSRVPTGRTSPPRNASPPSLHSPATPSDLLESDLETPDISTVPQHSASSLSIARESLRSIFMRARRDPGGTPQKNKTPRATRRSSFDTSDADVASRTIRSKWKGKRKSLSDEEDIQSTVLQPTDQNVAPVSHTLSINDIRERLLMDSQTQLQDQLPPSIYNHTDSTNESAVLQGLHSSNAIPPAATSTPQLLQRKRNELQLDSRLDSRTNSQSNLLDQDSEMQRAMNDVRSETESAHEFDQVPFPQDATIKQFEPSITPITPGGSRIPLTRSRLNSLDKSYGVLAHRKPNGELHRSVSRTSLNSTPSSMSLCSDEAERIRERERYWNKPKVPVRPSTPELKQGHRHGRFSLRMDSPMVGASSARRASIASMSDLSSNSVGSQAEWLEVELERERMHEREREWNKRRPKSATLLSTNSTENLRRRRSLPHDSRPDSAMSTSSTSSLHRQHSFSPSSGGGSSNRRVSSGEVSEGYIHERERNWNAPRPRWLQNPDARPSDATLSSNDYHPVTSPNGRSRSGSVVSQGDQATTHTTGDLSSSMIRAKPTPSPPPTPSRTTQSRTNPFPHTDPASYLSYRNRVMDDSPELEEEASSGPSLSPGPDLKSRVSNRHPSSKPSYIPIRSPRKSAPSSSRSHSNSAKPESVALQSYHPPTVVVHSPYRGLNNEQDLHMNKDDDSHSQDRTPTIRTVQPPPDTATTDSPSLHSSMSMNTNGTLQGPSPPPSPNTTRYQSYTTSSFLQTPPRSLANTGSPKVEFRSPSPPKGLPELPRPPIISDDEDLNESEDTSNILYERTPSRIPVHHQAMDPANLTTMKTPRPPGAWLTTPTPYAKEDESTRAQIDTSSEFIESRFDGGGLVTPVPSLSKGSILQTPAPPGAWVATPSTVSRKSVLKVRFEPPPSETTEEEQSSFTCGDISQTEDSLIHEALEVSPAPVNSNFPERSADVHTTTPDLNPPTTAPQSPKSPRKTKIRVLDAFGRETFHQPIIEDKIVRYNTNSTPRNRSVIRIVDAMGREVDDNESSVQSSMRASKPSKPLKHREALVRVRQGLSDLAQAIDEIDRTTPEVKLDDNRIQSLIEVSRDARTRREQLATHICTVEEKLQAQLKQKVQGNKTLMHVYVRPLPFASKFIWLGMIVTQIILIFILYRIALKQAREFFLNTYYDPFSPELHLYTIRPDTLRHIRSASFSSETCWITVFETLERDGWKAAIGTVWNSVFIFIYDLRRRMWEGWGQEGVEQMVGWPPT